MNNEPKLVPDDKYDPTGDREPYDTYVDDKLTGDEPREY